MSQLFRTFSKRLHGAFQYSLLPGCVDLATTLGTIGTPKRLKAANARRVLIDNTVLFHAISHETAWIDTGKSLWGGEIEIDTGYLGRIPVRADDDESDAGRSARYLPGIASLARRGHVLLVSSDELLDEQLTQPVGRYGGYGYFDYNMFNGIPFERIRDSKYSTSFDPLGPRNPSLKEQRRKRISTKTDALYQDLVSVLGQKNSQDSWHIATAEKNDCYCFLTMDFRLIRNMRAQANNASIRSLRTRVMTPEAFGRKFAILPISPRLFSYHNASFPVAHTENWPDSKRQKPARRLE